MSRFNVRAFAITTGLVWGLGLFAITWWIIAFDGQSPGDPTFIGKIYRGYEVTAIGSLIGLAWAFVDGLIGGAIFAWLYNLVAAKSGKATDAS